MIKVLLFLLFLIVFYQDLKMRAVHWVLFPLVFGISILYTFKEFQLDHLGANVMFLILLLGSLTVYLSLRNGTLVNITKGFFSWGDILFLVAIVPLFNFTSFMLFFTVGTLLTVIVHLLARLIVKQNETIPFAGYMALFTGLYLLFQPLFDPFIYLFA